MSQAISPPYQWFGGKSKVFDDVWRRFGAVPNYVEPFFGSGAMLLRRPTWTFGNTIPRETVNDYDGHLANFWRSVQSDPEAVALAASRPVNELDLHAIGDALFARPSVKWPMPPAEWVEWIREDETHYDAERAGRWCWFISNWIGGLPNIETGDHMIDAGRGVSRKRPHLGNAGRGVSRRIPHLGNAGRGSSPDDAMAIYRTREESDRALVDWMTRIADRIRGIRVCCGDWSRVCGKSVTWNNATPCAVFLDPPYSLEAGRANDLYTNECGVVANDVRAWCIEEGRNADMRIALCGYDVEHVELESHGWSVFEWKASGGMCNIGNGKGKDNIHRERIWFSPACRPPERTLF